MTGRLGTVLAAITLLTGGADEQPVDFTRDIQPLFRQHCVSCHGPRKAKGQFRLDVRAAALKGGLSGKAIVPGKSAQSPLLALLLDGDPEVRMPQPLDNARGKQAEPLPREKIELIRRWIDEGAAWPDDGARVEEKKHWAYLPPARPEPPAVRCPSLVRNPVDRFVLSRLEKEGLDLSAEAPRETLLRRVSLDLIGLPPTPDEIEAFLADRDPRAYETVVDRLLSSPHYGERWARPWLDLARYADSNGYERDGLRTMWKYRDWVIRALNEDMPFTQFTIEQLAGDLLPDATVDQRIATGFHRNSMLNEEDGVDKEETRWNTLVERVGTTATVWLGTTLACAQCHNHKYDPFSQKDFYRLLAFFETAEEPTLPVPTPEQERKKAALEAEIARLEEVMRRPTPELQTAFRDWELRHRNALGWWRVLPPDVVTTTGSSDLKVLEDGSVLASGPTSDHETYRFVFRGGLRGTTAIRLEALTDPSLPGSGPGRAHNGDFVLSEFKVLAQGDRPIRLLKPVADFASKYGWITQALDDKAETGWGIGPQVGTSHTAYFEVGTSLGYSQELTVLLEHESRHPGHALGRFRISTTDALDPSETLALPFPIQRLLTTPPDDRSPAQRDELAAYFRSIVPAFRHARDRIARCRKDIEALKIPTALVMRERPGERRPATQLRIRGNFLAKGEEVTAAVPAALQVRADAGTPDRLSLARWIADERNPLTARVAVNRAWAQIFGRGLVETGEDFGTQGAAPTHPELLDWLATDFMARGWSMKSLHRTIVTSAAYRQSSRVPPSLLERDPENRLLARGPSFRLDGETLRDLALSAAGLLSRKIGGPSVYPPQPEGTWKIAASKESEKWTGSTGEDRWRRGLYVFWRRSAPYPSFVAFDAPSREFCTARRARTNTPLQALTLLNDPAFFEAARALAVRMLKEGFNSTSRIRSGHRLCCSRDPRPEELRLLVELHQRSLQRYQEDPAAAKELGGPELAAMTMVANALLNLDETITKD
jgi:hypothetical protein